MATEGNGEERACPTHGSSASTVTESPFACLTMLEHTWRPCEDSQGIGINTQAVSSFAPDSTVSVDFVSSHSNTNGFHLLAIRATRVRRSPPRQPSHDLSIAVAGRILPCPFSRAFSSESNRCPRLCPQAHCNRTHYILFLVHCSDEAVDQGRSGAFDFFRSSSPVLRAASMPLSLLLNKRRTRTLCGRAHFG